MTTPRAQVETRAVDSVVWITLARPEALNALSPSMLEQIDAAIDAATQDPNVRCVVLTGQGRAFCTGADLGAVPAGAAGLEEFLRMASNTMRRIEDCPKPVIACVNGLALAGGLELILSADIVIAARSAEIGDGHAKFGLLPGAGGSVRLSRTVGMSRARFLMYTGTRFSAATMESWGLVHVTCEDSELTEQASSLAQSIARSSPLALRALKKLIAQSGDKPLDEMLALELAANKAHAATDDMMEGLAAFAEKRAPIFRG